MVQSFMKRLIFIAMLLSFASCSTVHKSDSGAFQGKWQGREIGGKIKGICFVTVSGDKVEYRGADTNEWYNATFTLRPDTNPKQLTCLTTGSSYPPIVGVPRYGIYRIEGDMIRLAINEAGDSTVPSGFDAPGARHFEFRRR